MTLARQSDSELQIIMGTIWERNSPSHIDVLNGLVVDYCLDQIRAGVEHHLEWHRRKDQPHLIEPGQPSDKWNPLVIGKNIF